MEKTKTLSEICTSYGIALVYLFGSQAEKANCYLRGESINVNDPLADIDIGVVFQKHLPSAAERYQLYADVFNAFADLFCPFPVDVSLLQENHAVFQVEALKGYCAFFANPNFKDSYEEMILRRAADFKPVLELFYKEALEGV